MKRILLAGIVALLPTVAIAAQPTDNCLSYTAQDLLKIWQDDYTPSDGFRVLDVVEPVTKGVYDGKVACAAHMMTDDGEHVWYFNTATVGGKEYLKGMGGEKWAGN
jgi:hypothetical protein